jgi:hypothetical protein
MAFEITRELRLASEKTNLEPQIVLEIDGVSTVYGVTIISKYAVIGDELIIGDDWVIGGLNPVEDQSDIISLSGTTTSIKQQLQPDKGIGSSISALTVALVDINQEATQLVSPGVVVEDILGRKAKVYLGFTDVAFPDDFVPIFRGIISDVRAQAGMVTLDISHPDQKKRQKLFPKATATLAADITNVATLLTTSETSPFTYMVRSVYGGDGLVTYLKIDNEWMQVENLAVAPDVWTVTRAQLGTAAAAHTAGAEIQVMYALRGNVMDLALWLMLSNDDSSTPYASVNTTSVDFLDIDTNYTNGFFFRGLDMEEKYGIQVGDQVVQPDNTKPNYYPLLGGITLTISEIIKRYDGTVVIVEVEGGGTLDSDSAGGYPIEFYSQYNVMNTGLGMAPDEVDIEEHLRIKRLYLSSFDVEIYLEDNEDVKELIEQQLYAVAGAYSLPRKSKASVGLHIGPIPGNQTKILNKDNIKDGSKLQVRRSISQNFYNTIIYKFDKSHETDEYATGVVTRSATSATRIPIGTKALVVEARGLRSTMTGETLAVAASNRRLNRYKFGAEFIDNVPVLFKTGLTIEVGDIALLDATGLNLLNSASGDRSPEPKLYEVVNKSIDLRTGAISLSLVDTSYSTQNRYGLIAPSSTIKAGLSNTQFIVEPGAYREVYGNAEGDKWSRFVTAESTVAIKVVSPDFTTRSAQTTIASVVGNTITVTSSLGFTPQAGDIVTLANYAYASTTETIKALYTFHTDSATFSDGKNQYLLL